MSTYFAVVNLDKKERGFMAVSVSDDYVKQEIIDWEQKHGRKWEHQASPSQFILHKELGWIKPSNGYLNWNSKIEAGIIFMEACSIAWGYKGAWFGDRVVVICDTSSEKTNEENSIDFDEMSKWTPRYFPISLDDAEKLFS